MDHSFWIAGKDKHVGAIHKTVNCVSLFLDEIFLYFDNFNDK